MELSYITEIISLVCGGGAGAVAMQLYTARVNKRKLEAEAEQAKAEALRKKQENKQDAFDAMYQELNKCLNDYSAIAEEYRSFRDKARKYEEEIQNRINDKCVELASLKSQITYLKGIRCYNTVCPNRIRQSDIKEKTNNKTE